MPISSREEALLNAVAARRDDMVEVLRELVRINTVNPYSGEAAGGSERAGQEALDRHLQRLGASTYMFEPAPDTFEAAGVIGPRERSWVGRPNLVGEWKFGSGHGPTLIVLGHMDTVGVEGMVDPFGARLEDGRVYGRGTSDCKGGLVSGLGAVEALLTVASDLDGKLIYLSVIDEECNGSGAGTIACALKGIRGDAAVSVDGAAGVIVNGCYGVITAEIAVHGKAGHGSLGNGVNAVEKGFVVAQAVRKFGGARQSAYPDCLLNLGIFSGGTHPAVIPDTAHMSLNIVYNSVEASRTREETGTWGGSQVWEDFTKTIRQAEGKDDWLAQHPSELTWVKDLVPYEVPGESRAVQEMVRAAADVAGASVPVRKMVAWTDSCWMDVLARTPIVVFGPATHDVVHGPDESIAVDDVVSAAKGIALYLHRYLSLDG